MKKRYNYKTNQRIDQSRFLISPPFRCNNPYNCGCNGVCFKHQFERNAPIETWCNTDVPPSNLATFLSTGGNY